MPGFRRHFDPSLLAGLVILACLAGCSDPEAGARFKLTRIDASWSNGSLIINCEQSLALSNEAREALIHGVPLTINTELTLRDTASRIRVADVVNHYEIRYLPLSNHYQLSDGDSRNVRTFPRLRHVMAELSKIRISITTGVLPAGNYEILARTRLDQEAMPPPMRLPVLLSAKWQHDSSWSSWPLEIQPGA
ncbi:DUF4390 domain-containing protein [Pseudomonadota bacterium]